MGREREREFKNINEVVKYNRLKKEKKRLVHMGRERDGILFSNISLGT